MERPHGSHPSRARGVFPWERRRPRLHSPLPTTSAEIFILNLDESPITVAVIRSMSVKLPVPSPRRFSLGPQASPPASTQVSARRQRSLPPASSWLPCSLYSPASPPSLVSSNPLGHHWFPPHSTPFLHRTKKQKHAGEDACAPRKSCHYPTSTTDLMPGLFFAQRAQVRFR
jgi:hypothetical protein